MAPRREGARLPVDARLFGYFTDQERRNEIANLSQDIEFVSALECLCLLFHLLLVEQSQTFFQRFFVPVGCS
jgi:hypothetical protein